MEQELIAAAWPVTPPLESVGSLTELTDGPFWRPPDSKQPESKHLLGNQGKGARGVWD